MGGRSHRRAFLERRHNRDVRSRSESEPIAESKHISEPFTEPRDLAKSKSKSSTELQPNRHRQYVDRRRRRSV